MKKNSIFSLLFCLSILLNFCFVDKAEAGMAPNAAAAGWFTGTKAVVEDAWNNPQTYIRTLNSTDQTLNSMQDMYYMIQAFKYLHDSGGIMGAVNYLSQATSMATGMASMGLSSYQGLANAGFGGLTAMSNSDYMDYMNGLSLASSTSGSLASAANSAGMIGQENSGVPFLEVVNGSQLGVQAALTTTQAVANIQNYRSQKDQLKTEAAVARSVHNTQTIALTVPQKMTTPCLNRPVFVAPSMTASLNSGTPCDTVTAPAVIKQTGPIGTGLTQQANAAALSKCINSMPQNAQAGNPVNCHAAAAATGSVPTPIGGSAPAIQGVQPGTIGNTATP